MYKTGRTFIVLAAVISLMVVFCSCSEEAADKTPVITLQGDNVELTLGDEYLEPGYTAKDYKGNDITASVKVEMPDTGIVGGQIIKYTVTSDGETATASRVLTVRHKVPDPEDWEYYYDGLPILMYHNVYDPMDPPANLHNNYISTTDLESHLQYLLDEEYYFPTWQEVRDFVDGKIDLPEKSIVLCFDDASDGFIEHGIPLIEQYQVPVTSFVIVSTKGEVMTALDLEYVTLQSHSYDMHRDGGYIGHGGVFTALSYEDGMADLKQSVDILGNGDAFAYPFGDYTELCVEVVKGAGFVAAVTTNEGQTYPGDDPYLLNRVRINLGTDLELFKDLIE